MADNSCSLDSLQEQLLFELLKAVDKIKESEEPRNFSKSNSFQTELDDLLNNLFDRISSITGRLDNIENEIASIEEILDGLKRKADMLYQGLKILYSDCIIGHEF